LKKTNDDGNKTQKNIKINTRFVVAVSKNEIKISEDHLQERKKYWVSLRQKKEFTLEEIKEEKKEKIEEKK